jgi:hypothetical protein
MNYDSIAESTSAPALAALKARRCTSFSPYTADFYHDASGEQLDGKPDFVIDCEHGPVFIDLKDGALNNHYTRESSREALADEYMRLFHRPTNGLSHAALSSALYNAPSRAGRAAALAHGFNHSLWKHLALQSRLGWRHYIVCFKENPKPADAERYCAAGLLWCTLKTLPQLLIRIKLEAAGVPISFVHRAQKFQFEVKFDDGTATPAEVRSHFLAAVEFDKIAVAAQRAQEAVERAAGISPF